MINRHRREGLGKLRRLKLRIELKMVEDGDVKMEEREEGEINCLFHFHNFFPHPFFLLCYLFAVYFPFFLTPFLVRSSLRPSFFLPPDLSPYSTFHSLT